MDFPWAESNIIKHSSLLAESFMHWTKKELIPAGFDLRELSFHLYHAPFALVSHGTEKDPIFNYANIKAQELWKMPWEQFTKMPSRLSAEPVEHNERQKLLEEAETKGFISNYSGIRITSAGERFRIKDTTLWNVVDKAGMYSGQAAVFSSWEFL